MKKKDAIKLLNEATDVLDKCKELRLAHKVTGEQVTAIGEQEMRAMVAALSSFMYWMENDKGTDTGDFIQTLFSVYLYAKHKHGDLDIDLNDAEGVDA